jgi:hypothetical protein
MKKGVYATLFDKLKEGLKNGSVILTLQQLEEKIDYLVYTQFNTLIQSLSDPE